MYLTAAILLIFRGKVEEHVKIMMLHFVLTSLTPAYHSPHSLSNGIQDSLGFWIPRRGFRILGTAFQSFSVELGLWIPKVSGILDSLGGIRDSKA